MTVGPGKYDDLCTMVRKATNARGVIIIVVGGNNGHGFSCQTDLETVQGLPDILEQIASQIRRDAAG